MKKKLFTLLTLMLCVCSGAWAGEIVIYSMTNPTAPTGNLNSQASSDVTATFVGGSATVYNGKSSAAALVSSGQINLGGSGNSYFHAVLTTEIAEGDIISIEPVASTNTYYINNSSSKPKNATTFPFTVPKNSGFIGKKEVWVFKADASKFSTFKVTRVVGPTITNQPSDGNYEIGTEGVTVSVTAKASGSESTLEYQWYSCDDAEKTNATAISGATSSSYSVNTSVAATYYYFCVVTEKNASNIVVGDPIASDVATVNIVSSQAPELAISINNDVVRVGTSVTLSASITAGVPTPTLQWYTCDSEGNNTVAIDGETATTYTPSTDNAGTFYYLAKATNSVAEVASNVVSLSVVSAGVSGSADNLETITSDYTFIADEITGNGKLGLTAGYLYEDNHIYSPKGNTVATNKGSSTIGGKSHLNSLRVKSSTQDPLAFKVGGPCVVTFYGETRSDRGIKIGTAVDDDTYGTVAGSPVSISIPTAGVVYLTGTGDRFIAGFEVHFAATITPGHAKITYVTEKALDFSNVDGLKAYVATGASAAGVATAEVGAVPAGTPLLLKGTANTEYSVPVVAEATAPETNLLCAGDGTTVFDGTTYDYLLAADGKFYQIGSGTIAVGKAYLHLDSNPAGARSLSVIFADDMTTGIEAIANETKADNTVYNLGGQRVAKPTKGLYIVNGKKIIK